MSKNLKQLIIKAPEGQVIDMEHLDKTNEIRFINEIPEELPFPTSWKYKKGETVYYVDNISEIRQARFENNKKYHNCYLTEELAKQSIVFAQLIFMRDQYREIELHNDPKLEPIDWSNNKIKHIIEVRNGGLKIDAYVNTYHTFSFASMNTCKEFLKHYSEAILYCKNLLG